MFIGETYLQAEPPIDPSSRTSWRRRLGEAGVDELLAEALERAEILCGVGPQIAIVDRGCRGEEVEGVKIYHQGLRATIRWRNAIEPAIGHIEAGGKLDRNWLKGALGDAMHAVRCGAGHSLRVILRKLRLLYTLVLVALLSRCSPAMAMA